MIYFFFVYFYIFILYIDYKFIKDGLSVFEFFKIASSFLLAFESDQS